MKTIGMALLLICICASAQAVELTQTRNISAVYIMLEQMPEGLALALPPRSEIIDRIAIMLSVKGFKTISEKDWESDRSQPVLYVKCQGKHFGDEWCFTTDVDLIQNVKLVDGTQGKGATYMSGTIGVARDADLKDKIYHHIAMSIYEMSKKDATPAETPKEPTPSQ